MQKYKIVSVIWDDHVYIDRDKMLKDIDEGIVLDISFGILFKETEKSIALIHNIERYGERDDSSYTLILKSAIQGIKEYGEIELDLRLYD